MRRSLLLILLGLLLMAGLVTADPLLARSGREAEINDAALTYVRQRTAILGCEAKTKRMLITAPLDLPDGMLDYEILAPRQWEGWGNAGISIIIRKNDRVVKNVSARVEVQALADMVVTTRQIDRGSIISADDLALRRQDLAAVQGRYVRRIEDLSGKRAKITMRANIPVRNDQFERIPIIKPGQIVTIIAENQHMRITATGKAKGSGAEGDTITVQNLGSMKELPAKIIDANTVQVLF